MNVLEWSRGAITTGYHTERKRMKNKDNECYHHHFNSIASFFKYIQKLSFNKKAAESDSVSFQFGEQFIQLIGSGCCKQCVLYIVSNIDYFMRSDAFVTAGIRDRMFGDIENIACYFVNCMQYRQTANFILNQSNIWKQMINIHGINLKQLQNDTSKIAFGNYSINDTNNIDYISVALMVFQLLRNIKLLKNYHWNYIILNETYFNDLLSFIEQQLTTGMYQIHPYGQQCMYAIFAFVCCIWYHMKHITKNNDRINEWIRSLETIAYINNKNRCELISSFISLQDKKYVTHMFYYFKDIVKEVHHLKWLDMQCQYGKCKKRRTNRKKFYKCKSCKVVRYCSKKCQKLDWNRNYHKILCIKLKNMQY